MRFTADCPCVDPQIVTDVIEMYFREPGRYDYVAVATGAGAANDACAGRRFPDGLDAEIFSFDALERAHRDAVDAVEREHATLRIWSRPDEYRIGLLFSPSDLSHYRWTVDDEKGWAFVASLYEHLFREDRNFGLHDVLRLLSDYPELREACTDPHVQEQYRQFYPTKRDGARWG